MDDQPAPFPMDVGRRVVLSFSWGMVRSRVRGWKEGESILVDRPEEDGRGREGSVGSSCRVGYVRHGILHRFLTEVLGTLCLPGMGDLLALRFPEGMDSRGLRSAPRIKAEFPARILLPGGENWPCTVLDVSRAGCRIQAHPAALDKGDRLMISCVLPNENPLVDVSGVVRRTYRDHGFGIEFEPLLDPQREVLDGFLNIFTSLRSPDGAGLPQQGLVGFVEDVSFPDLLMILANSRRSYCVELKRPRGSGKVFLKEGEVWWAEGPRLHGSDALLELFSWPTGRYRIQRAKSLPKRNVHDPLDYLLLEFAHRLDQSALGEDAAVESPRNPP